MQNKRNSLQNMAAWCQWQRTLTSSWLLKSNLRPDCHSAQYLLSTILLSSLQLFSHSLIFQRHSTAMVLLPPLVKTTYASINTPCVPLRLCLLTGPCNASLAPKPHRHLPGFTVILTSVTLVNSCVGGSCITVTLSLC